MRNSDFGALKKCLKKLEMQISVGCARTLKAMKDGYAPHGGAQHVLGLTIPMGHRCATQSMVGAVC